MRKYTKCAAYVCANIYKTVGKLFRRKFCKVIIVFFIVIGIHFMINGCDNKTDGGPSQMPVIVWWTNEFTSADVIYCRNNIRCSINHRYNKPTNAGAYLFYASSTNFEDLPLPRSPNKIIWALVHDESPRNVPLLLHEKMLNLFNFSSTFSRHSNVPFPLQFVESMQYITSKEFFVDTSEKNSLLKDISPVLFIQSDCDTTTDRDLYVKELMAFIPIDCYGICLRNKELPADLTINYLNALYSEGTIRFFAKYKFIIAIENGICDDYVTEKFWRAIFAGTVPIYFGSPTIRDWMPNNKSAILVEDFPTPQLMSEHLKKLLNDDGLYEEYLEHKIKGVVRNKRILEELSLRPYQNNFAEILDEFVCLLCENLHETVIKRPNIVNKSHYNCSKPISAVTLKENPENNWVSVWKFAQREADSLYNKILLF